jgi:hypothetical protein
MIEYSIKLEEIRKQNNEKMRAQEEKDELRRQEKIRESVEKTRRDKVKEEERKEKYLKE